MDISDVTTRLDRLPEQAAQIKAAVESMQAHLDGDTTIDGLYDALDTALSALKQTTALLNQTTTTLTNLYDLVDPFGARHKKPDIRMRVV